jgi:hypothetical protein
VAALVWSYSTNVSQIWVDGVLAQSSTAAGAFPDQPTIATRLGARQYPSYEDYADIELNWLYAFAQRLTESEIVTLSANPWQLFAPPRRIWVQLEAATGGTTTNTTLSATTTASASFTSMKMKLLELLATLAQSVGLPRAINATRSATTTAVAAAVRQASAVRAATTTATTAVLRQVGAIRSATSAAAASFTSIKVKLLTLAASSAAGAAFLRQVSTARAAAVTATSTAVRQVNAARLATTSAAATFVRAISATLAATKSAVAAIATQVTNGGQFARPIADVTADGWTPSTGTDLYAMLNEETQDDATYIYSPNNPIAQEFEVQLGSVGDPGTSADHVVRLGLKAINQTTTFTMSLVQGSSPGTVIATWDEVVTVAQGVVTRPYTLSASEANSITNYSDLRIRGVAHG